MQAIVVVDKNWGIGRKNKLLFHLPLDLKNFKDLTTHKVVVMGNNTLKSLPNGNPLKDRTNIVLQKNKSHFGDYISVKDIDELFCKIKGFPDDDVFVIGGAMTYKALLPYCKKAFVTKVNADGNADTFFENIDSKKDWTCISESQELETNGYLIRFTVYQNNNVLKF